MGPTARFFFAVLGIVATATLVMQLNLNIERYEGVGPALWKMARYFTLWTAALVAVSTLYIAASPDLTDARAGLSAAIVLFSAVVGGVYHVLLRPTDDPQGYWAYTNAILHYVLPIGVAALWFFVMPKGRLFTRAPIVWLVFPLVYILATLARGAYYGDYPYFFLDIGQHGAPTVGVNAAGLCATFVVGGFLLVLVDRLMARGRSAAGRAGA